MKTFVYDTETSGLPDWRKPSEDPCQPHIVQIAAELFDDESGKVLHAMTHIIRPNGWEIPDDVAAVHGITTEIAKREGLPMVLVLPNFLRLWQMSEHRVAHNETFDARMIRIEIKRDAGYTDEFADQWKAGPSFCTQAKSSSILKLPPTEKMIAAGRNHPKSPNLGEAYEFFTGKKLVDAHDAAVDVAACKAVYLAIKSGQREARKVMPIEAEYPKSSAGGA